MKRFKRVLALLAVAVLVMSMGMGAPIRVVAMVTLR